MEEQKLLFEIIKSKTSEQFRLADIIEELLEISTDSAYRRIRGEKELSFSELKKICNKFNISIDELFNHQSNQGASFHYSPVNLSNQKSYIDYMKRLLNVLNNLKSVFEKEIYFTAQDIPFYHFLKYPELTFFKLFAWNDTLSRKPISFCEFCNNLDKKQILPIYEQIYNSYLLIQSKEIWTAQSIDSTLRLIEYYFDTGAFESKETVLHLLNQLNDLLCTVKGFADDDFKGGERKTPFSLYVCSVDLENNFMLTKRGDNLSCNIKLYTINSIATDNSYLCDETMKWIEDLISKSILVSGTSVKERFRFFQSSKNKIDVLINKIEIS